MTIAVPPRPRHVVLEGHSPAQVTAAATALAAGLTGSPPAAGVADPPGPVIVEGWRRPPEGIEIICVGRVKTAADASDAVLAAVAGASVVVDAVGERDVIDQLCDDLRHLGDLEHRVGIPASTTLKPVEQELLSLLLGGATLGQAARALHLSRRTADRRLAAARIGLGAGSTSEAVSAAARLGIKPVTIRSTSG